MAGLPANVTIKDQEHRGIGFGANGACAPGAGGAFHSSTIDSPPPGE